MLDIVNIAHPAFILLGSYIAYVVNVELGVDPSYQHSRFAAFYALGGVRLSSLLRIVLKSTGGITLRGLAFFFGLLFVTEVCLLLIFGVDYRSVDAAISGQACGWAPGNSHALTSACLTALAMFAGLQIFLARTLSAVRSWRCRRIHWRCDLWR